MFGHRSPQANPMKFAFDPGPVPSLPHQRYRCAFSGAPYLLRRPQLCRSCPRDGRQPGARAALFLRQTGGRDRGKRRRSSLPRPAPPICITRSSWWSRSAAGGSNIPIEDANAYIFGYAVGNDLTRRDLQFAARDIGRPWDTAKGFDHSAPITAIHPIEETGVIEKGEIWLSVNDVRRQVSNIDQLIWSIPEIIVELSQLYTLIPGDLIFTGTPSGVGPLVPGDDVDGGVELLATLRFSIATR